MDFRRANRRQKIVKSRESLLKCTQSPLVNDFTIVLIFRTKEIKTIDGQVFFKTSPFLKSKKLGQICFKEIGNNSLQLEKEEHAKAYLSMVSGRKIRSQRLWEGNPPTSCKTLGWASGA